MSRIIQVAWAIFALVFVVVISRKMKKDTKGGMNE